MNKVEIRHAGPPGRGVFALQPLRAGEIIADDPVVELSAEDVQTIRATPLRCYWWNWHGGGAVAFGLASMLNDSQTPNATVQRRRKQRRLRIVAARAILPGEEITIDYGEA
jgi:SET domain-containing protein